MPAHHKLCVGVDRGPSPHIANAEVFAKLGLQVALFGVAEGPNLIQLKALAAKVR
jgi:hypothetical protein